MRISGMAAGRALGCLAGLVALSACGDEGFDTETGTSTSGYVGIDEPTEEATYSTDDDIVRLHGTAHWGNWSYNYETGFNTGCVVTWTNAATGESGIACSHVTGWYMYTHEWSATIPLVMGDNRITMTSSGGGLIGTDSITVIRVSDRTRPSVWIDYKTCTLVRGSPHLVKGTASDNIGIVSLAWANLSSGASGTMPAQSPWSFYVSLVPGDNTIKVIATDAAGFTGEDTLTVHY